jgi:hypothetical protein
MAISQTDIDALQKAIVNPTKAQTTRFQDQEYRTEQLSLDELVNRLAVAQQLLNPASAQKPRCSLVAFRRTDCL